MRIGIDISQIVHEGTGVSNYVQEIVRALLAIDHENNYILFGSSLRKQRKLDQFYETVKNPKVSLCSIPMPPIFLDFLWNRLHIVPIEWFTGPLDIFWSSDWTQPPLTHAKGITTVHDVSFLRYPETFTKAILDVQKRRLAWVKRECKVIYCDSEATKQDVMSLVGIARIKLKVIYPGFTV